MAESRDDAANATYVAVHRFACVLQQDGLGRVPLTTQLEIPVLNYPL